MKTHLIYISIILFLLFVIKNQKDVATPIYTVTKWNRSFKAKKITLIKPQNKIDPIVSIFEDINYSEDLNQYSQFKYSNLLGLSANKSFYYLKKVNSLPLFIGGNFNYVDKKADLVLFYIF